MLQVLLFYGHSTGEVAVQSPTARKFLLSPQVSRRVCLCMCVRVRGLIVGVKGKRKREEVSLWAYPFLTSHSIHHFVVAAAEETAMWCIPFEKST